ncbi:TIGR01777 family oxidoreductase [Terribacillus sp. DMT04]|uniref:TIGR01777 family oxidoreductase n=1 Tax=Terribacillus sp. DMT04 TaxID=2850441 RepID=UPI001C2C4EDC|nr:TIGR01777 family oxidoreductase [Terribacillus sp. DMT04]QXE02519.1 TIGR01777 family oxidoreductase [Terribacillus sp. DMT04]
MNIVISGGTGFVGKQLAETLMEQGHHVYILTRSPEEKLDTKQVTYIGWLKKGYDPLSQLPEVHAVVNLAGTSLFGKWTEEKKKSIRSSRLEATETLVDMIGKMPTKPKVLVSGSAVGFYGTSEQDSYTEETNKRGEDFLADVTYEWEQAALQANAFGVRTVLARFGIVLGDKGALPLMQLPFRYFAGGKIGSGEQWLSWIHVQDAAGIIAYAIEQESINGALNVTAPHPRRNKDFSKALANTLHRPYWTTAPAPIIQKALGEMSTLILEGQCVYPKKAMESGYTFQYPNLSEALEHAL